MPDPDCAAAGAQIPIIRIRISSIPIIVRGTARGADRERNDKH
jgi:hypothetical protein